MPNTNDPVAQVRSITPVLTVAYAAISGVLVFVAIIGVWYDVPISGFNRDPAAIHNANPFTGVLSNIGILFWCSAAAVCLFAAALQARAALVKVVPFLLFSGLLTAVLLLDDLFMLHETVIPGSLHIPQKLVYAGYLALILTYLVKFRSAILQTEYIMLAIACGFFGLSILCDMVLPNEGIEFLVEDGFKLFGIVTWFIYFTRTCLHQVRQLIAGK